MEALSIDCTIEGMTDYQFAKMLDMIILILKSSEDLEYAICKLEQVKRK